MTNKIHIGDNVVVTTGKSRGHQGKVEKILRKQDRVIVEGANKKVKHVKARDGVPGERVEVSGPIHISNIALVDAKTKKASRVGFEVGKDGKKTRVTRSSGSAIEKAPKSDTKKKSKEETPKPIKA